MKAPAESKRIKLCCEVILMLAILTGGGATAMTVYSVTNPPLPGGFVIDYVPEIGVMAGVLNVGLPLAVVALGTWLVLQARGGRVQWVTAALTVAGFVGVFGCALALWIGLVAMHPGIDLWSTRIWWNWI
jgi:hypothetical protein